MANKKLKLRDMTCDNIAFRPWLGVIDRLVGIRFCGLSTADFPDLTLSRDLYDDGFNVCEAYDVWKDDQINDDPSFAEVL